MFCWEHRSFLAVFAAGNSGDTRGPASVLSPALAKNALAVGAALPGFAAFDVAAGSAPDHGADTYGYDWVAEFSSRGGAALAVPWLKPDLLASGGAYVWSAAAGGPAGQTCGPVGDVVTGMAGTSMAAPMAAGAAALTRQYYLTRRGYEPMASLVKAVLAASATPVRGVFPARPMSVVLGSGTTYAPYQRAYLEGHGRLSLDRVLHVAGADNGGPGTLSNEGTALQRAGEVRRYCVTLDGPAAPLDLTVALSWTDFPTSVTAVPALVNDLDLHVSVVAAGTGAVVREFVPPNGLPGRDGQSTMELVRLGAFDGVGRRLQVEVRAHAVGFGEQSFSLVVAVHDGGQTRVLLNGRALAGPDQPGSGQGTGACLVCSDPGQSFSNQCEAGPTPPAPTTRPTAAPPAPAPVPVPVPPPPGPVTCGTLDCLAGAGLSVPGPGCDNVCVCLPGWTGVRCDSCAPSPDPSLVAWLCVGLVPDRGLPPTDPTAGQQHALVAVPVATVPGRLDGSYYRPDQGQSPDSRPGHGDLDCWCLPLARSVPHQQLTSQAGFAAAATDYLSGRETLLAVALPAPTTASPSPTTAPTPQPTPPVNGPAPRATTSVATALAATLAFLGSGK